ncbi:MAG: hypothetical protein ACTSRK_15185 [Promethearchaeota archaeon]
MSDSVLAWMKHNEKRFHKRDTQENSVANSSKQDNSRKLGSELQTPKNTMDKFLRPATALAPKSVPISEPPLFDDDFSLSDFRTITQQWIEDNLIAS